MKLTGYGYDLENVDFVTYEKNTDIDGTWVSWPDSIGVMAAYKKPI